MADIDRLDIIISAEASKAEKQLNKLKASLEKLSDVLGGLNTSGLSNLSDGVEKLSSAMNSMNRIQTKDFSKIAKNLVKIFDAVKGANSVNTTELLGLANSIRMLDGVDVKSIESISGILGKLSKFDPGSIGNVSDGLGKAVLSIGALSEVSFNDNNLRNVINSLTRLFKSDFDKFNSEQFRKAVSVIVSLGNIPDISKSINQTISSLAKLMNAGNNDSLTANSLPLVISSLKTAVKDLSKMPDVSTSVNNLVASIARLASTGKKTGDTADGLDKLAKETIKFFETMKNAPVISNNTLRMTEALSRLAGSGNKLEATTNQITSAFNKIAGLGKKAENQISKAAKSIVSSFRNIGIASSSLRIASINLGTLLSGAVLLRGVRELADFSKSALGLGSDITEVENVVDVSFGNMASKAYEFAKTATSQFGLSELSAKRYSGTMMAMLKSSGVAQSAAANMSTTLAGLAGDFSSFYNLTTDEAFTKIRSGISGEIEPLKQLGINMSVANLEAYALSQGIKTAYSSMSQAEKVILRYNYLMSVTGDQQGDFARTSGNWANQVRLLQLNFQSLKATIGQGLISAILPAVKTMNLLLAKLTQVAEAFRRFMYTLSGKKLEGSQSGIANNLSGLDDVSTGLDRIADAGNNASGGLDDASDSAKKLKKALSVLPFDEINKLNESVENLSNSGIGAANGSIAPLSVPSFGGLDEAINSLRSSSIPEEVSRWADRIRKAFLREDWEGLGNVIAGVLNRGLQKVYGVIDWKNVGPKITKFTDAFTRTFNSLADNLDWDLLGRTVGAGVNTTVTTLNQLIDGIDWKNLGYKFSVGVNGIAGEVDWYSLGNLLGGKFMVAWDALSGFVGGLDYSGLGSNFAGLLNGAFEELSFSDISITLTNFINGGFSSLSSFVSTFKWNDLADNVTSGLNTAFENMKWEDAGESLEAFFDEMDGFMLQTASGTDWEEFGNGIGKLLDKIDWIEHLSNLKETLKQIFSGIWIGLGKTSAGKFVEAIAAFAAFYKLLPFVNGLSEFFTGETVGTLMTNAFKKMLGTSMADASSEVSDKLIELEQTVSNTGSTASGVSTIFLSLKNILMGGGPITAEAGVAAMLSHTNDVMEQTKNFSGDASQAIGLVSAALMDAANQSSVSKEKLLDLIPTIGDVSNGAFNFDESFQRVIDSLEEAGISSNTFKSALSTAMEDSAVASNEYTQKISEYLGAAEKSIGNLSGTAQADFSTIDRTVSDASDNIWSVTDSTWSDSYKAVTDSLNAMKGASSEKMRQIFDNVSEYTNSIWLITANNWDVIGEKISNVLGDINDNISSELDLAAQKFSNLGSRISGSIGDLYSVGRNVMLSFKNGFESVHIRSPRITMDYSSWQNSSGSYSWRWNSNVNWYANGGFPNAGELFVANDNGPEMIGKIGRKNVVANNNQIADGIKSAVVEGMTEVMMAASAGQNDDKAYILNVTVKTEDDEVLARAVEKGRLKRDMRYNPCSAY